MAWYEIALISFFLGSFIVWLGYVAYDQHKTNVAYMKALSNIEKIHYDLVEICNVLNDTLFTED